MQLPAGLPVALPALTSTLPLRPPLNACQALEVQQHAAICPAYSYPFLWTEDESGGVLGGLGLNFNLNWHRLPDPVLAYLVLKQKLEERERQAELAGAEEVSESRDPGHLARSGTVPVTESLNDSEDGSSVSLEEGTHSQAKEEPRRSTHSGSESESKSPWTEPPGPGSSCRRAARGVPSQSEHCVFTHTAFNNRLGLALVTTRETVRMLAAQPPLNGVNTSSSSAQPQPGLHGSATNQGGSSGSGGGGGGADALYTAKEIPGKGLGLVATRPIRADSKIMDARPAVMVDDEAWRGMRRAELQVLVGMAVGGLSEGLKKEFVSLDSSGSDDTGSGQNGSGSDGGGKGMENGQGRREYGVMVTNAFRVTVKFAAGGHDNGDGVVHVRGGVGGKVKEKDFHAVFPEVSRLNHDCAPNLGYYFDSATLSQKVYAVRDILPGEELTVSYVDVIQPRSIRQSRLHSGWSFACTCPRCTLEPHLLAESDDRVAQMQQLRRELDDYSSTSTAATPERAELLVILYELEHLHVRIYEAYYRAALEWNGVGDAARAAKYARLCLDKGLLLRGEDRPFVKSMRELLKDAKAHWSWRFRVKKRQRESEAEGGSREGDTNR